MLSLLTSNLVTFEMQSFHDKHEFTVIGAEIVIKLFKLEESFKFIEETIRVHEKVKSLNLR